jgi:hypothetical protein
MRDLSKVRAGLYRLNLKSGDCVRIQLERPYPHTQWLVTHRGPALRQRLFTSLMKAWTYANELANQLEHSN